MNFFCKFIKFLVFFILFSFIINDIAISQIDTLFWFVAPEVTEDHYGTGTGGEPIKLVFTSMENEATVTISMPQNNSNFPDTTIIVAAGETEVWDLTHRIDDVENFYIYANQDLGNRTNRGIKISSDEEITVYYESGQEYNCDLFSLKGNNALGTEFYTSFQTRHFNVCHDGWDVPAYSNFDVVFTEDNTYLTIDIPANKTLYVGPDEYTDTTVTFGPFYPGHTFVGVSAWVNDPVSSCDGGIKTSDDTRFGRSALDHLSGLRVTSNKNIAITISDDSMKSLSEGCYDLGGDQTIPVDLLGKQYIIVRGQLDIGSGYDTLINDSWYDDPPSGTTVYNEAVYIMATDDDTKIEINGISITTLDAGETYVYEINTSEVVTLVESLDSSIYVLHVSGFGCEMGEAIVPPVDACTGSPKVGFSRSDDDGFFLNILARQGYEGDFTLNGAPTALIQSGDFTDVGSTDWSYARIGPIGTGDIAVGSPYFIENKDVFHLGIINGGAGTGTRYGYFSNFNVVEIEAFVADEGGNFTYGCKNEPIQLEVSGGDSVTWSPSIYMDDTTSLTPTVTITGNDLYYEYIATIYGYCDLTDSKTVGIQLLDNVTSSFSSDKIMGCSPLTVNLTNLSNGAKYFKWDLDGDGDFDDDRYDTIPSPYIANYSFSHTFPANTTDTIIDVVVALVCKGPDGCRDTMRRTISIIPEISPVISSNYLGPECSPSVITFSNNTVTPIDPDSMYYLWQISTGFSSTSSPFNYTFENLTSIDTSYQITLRATSNFGCYYYDTSYVTIHPRVNASFILNNLTFCAPDSTQIINLSSGPNLRYDWDFGNGDTYSTNSKTTFYEKYDETDVPFNQVNFEYFDIELAIEDEVSNCVDTTTQTIRVNPGIETSFEPDQDTTDISPLTIDFTNTSQTYFDSAYFEWEFGDGTFSNQIHPTHTFTNINPNGTTYEVTMYGSTKYNCRDTSQVTINVTVYSPIEARININNTSGCSPYIVTLNNGSIGTNHVYEWDFGDGNDTIVYNKNTIYHTYSLPSSQVASQSYEIKLLVTDTVSSATSKDSVIVNVYPPVDAGFTSTYEADGCQPFIVQYTDNSSNSAITYKWQFSDGATSNAENPSHTFINTASSPQTFQASLIAYTQYGCSDTTNYETYTVNPEVVAGMSIDSTAGCSPFRVSADNNSTNGTVYTWYFGDGTDTVTSVATISKTYTNSNPTTESYTIKLMAEYGAGGCADSIEQNIYVYPEADVSFTSDVTSGCEPLEVQFTNSSSNVKYNFWDFGDNSTSNKSNPSHNYTNPGTTPLFRTVELIGLSDHSCSDTFTSTITVMPYIEANFYVDTANSCSPLQLNIYNITEGANQYSWYIDGVLDTITYNTSSFMYTFYNSTSTIMQKQIKLVAENTLYGNCTSEDIVTVSIYPVVTANISVSATEGCHPLTINFSSASSTGATGTVPYKWSFGDGNNSTLANPTHTFYNTGTNDSIYIISLLATSQYQCSDIITQSVTIHPLIEAHFEVDKTFGCPDLDVQFTNLSTSTATDFDWDFGDGNISVLENPSNTFINNNPVTYIYDTVSLTVTDNNHGGCSDSYSKIITVYPKPNASFLPKDTIDCHPFDVQFVNNSRGNQLKYYWEFDANSTSVKANPLFTFLNTNTSANKQYEVKLRIVSDENCESRDSTIISVYPYLFTEFSLDEYAGCPPFDIAINNNTQGATSYNWDFGDGTSSLLESPTKQYPKLSTSAITTYTITLTASNTGCTQSYSKNVSIYPYVITEFEPRSGCQPFKVDLNNLSQGYNLAYYWDFDDGGTSSVESPTHIFYNLGSTDSIRNVKLTAISEHGCTDSFSANDTIFANPEARFELENSADCSPFTVEISNTSNTSRYYWDYGDGQNDSTSNPKVTHEYKNTSENPKSYNISLIVTNINGCKDTLVQPISVYPSVKAAIGLADEDTAGCNPEEIFFTNNTASLPKTSALWDFGDGETSMINDPYHIFTNESISPKKYQISLTVESRYGCSHTDYAEVNIYPSPVADFIITPRSQVFPESTIQIADQTNTGNWNYSWDFGDDTGIKTGEYTSYTYASEGDPDDEFRYYITLQAENSLCKSSATKTIQILPHKPIAIIEPDKIAGCPPLEIKFLNSSFYDHKGGWWDFGDSTYSHYDEYIKTYNKAGVYDVKLEVEGYGGEHDTSVQITVYDAPIALFETTTPLVYIVEDTAYFKNYSSFADYYTWNLGDGNYSNDFEPQHIYMDEGVYDISLLVQSNDGCVDSMTIRSAVKAESSCIVRFPNTFVPSLGGEIDGHYPVNDKNDNIFHVYFREGLLDEGFKLEVFNRWGELIFMSEDISYGWNGYYQGELVDQGVYIYKVTFKCTNKSTKVIVNSITVLHNK